MQMNNYFRFPARGLGIIAFLFLAHCGDSASGTDTAACEGLPVNIVPKPAFSITLESAQTGELICNGGVRVTKDTITFEGTVLEEDDGCYYIAGSSSGTYALEATAPNFRSVVREDIEVGVVTSGSNCGKPITHIATIELQPADH